MPKLTLLDPTKTGRQAKGRALIDAFERQQQAEKRKDRQKPSLELAQR